MQAWDAAKDATRDTEMKARIGGVIAHMESFDFFFGVELGWKLLNIVDNLSHSLQSTRLSACEGQKSEQRTKLTFQSIRSDQCFDLFWNDLETRRLSIDVPDPTLPRCRKVPPRFETGKAAPEYPTNVKDHYRRIYYQAIDNCYCKQV